jgi:hypothetical protein
MLLAGASAVQMTSAILAGGFGVIEIALAEFTAYLARKDMTARALIGRAADQLASYQDQPSRPGYWREFVAPGGLDPDVA